jgi:hypothetical protein
MLGLKRGALEGLGRQVARRAAPARSATASAPALDSVLDQRRGRLVQDFRLRTPDGHFHVVRAESPPGGRLRRRGGPASSARSPTSPKTRPPKSACCTTPCTTTSPACRTVSSSSTASKLVLAMFAKSDPPNLRPTVIVIDLDRFKQVNDSVGIAVGDSILLTLARRLARLLKPQDTLARLAGDQFGTDPDLGTHEPGHASSAFAETIRKHHPRADRLRRPRDLPDRVDRTSPSADPPVFAAPRKSSRTPSSRCITPSASAATASTSTSPPCARARPTALTLEAELRRAIEREEITILYQPIVRLEDRTIAGFEALGPLGAPQARPHVAGRIHHPSPRRSA